MWTLLQSSLRISPPLPFLPLSGVSRDPLKMGVGSRLDQDQAALAAVTSSPASVSKRWPGASAWPSWDLLDSPEDPFSIEREARLHRQAAGKLSGGSQQALVCVVTVLCFWEVTKVAPVQVTWLEVSLQQIRAFSMRQLAAGSAC